MAAPDYPFEAARVIEKVTYADGPDGPVEVHRVKAYSPGDLVPASAVTGNPEAGPDAWLKLGPDVRYRAGHEPEGADHAAAAGKPRRNP